MRRREGHGNGQHRERSRYDPLDNSPMLAGLALTQLHLYVNTASFLGHTLLEFVRLTLTF